jgi:cardiolipin synthase
MAVRFLSGNRLKLLRSGVEYFPALEEAIHAARHEIFIETYIYQGDDTGWRITEALVDAARRGVIAHLMVDGFGSKSMPREMLNRLCDSGVRLLVFRPELWHSPFQRDRLRRLHRKLAVADGDVAFVGGINIIDDFDTPRQKPPRYDYAVKIEGPLVGTIRDEAARLWNRITLARLEHRWRVRRAHTPRLARKGSQSAALVVRDNIRHRRDIEDAYLEAIESAQQEIIIANAYFFPGIRFRRALIAAAARGVRVVLLLQGRVEYVLLHYASRALYGTLLEAGVEIYEYHRSFLHAKVAVVDGYWATVGSSNIDPFSLLLAREANIVVENHAFASDLRQRLQQAVAHGAVRLDVANWQRRAWPHRVLSWLAYGGVRIMLGLAGFRRWV